MQRWINILVKFVEFVVALFSGKSKPVADVSETNVQTIKAGLQVAPDTAEVVEARLKIEAVAGLREDEREKVAGAVKEAQEVLEKHLAVDPSSIKVTDDLMDKIRRAEREQRERKNR
jgi:septum formation topological specificity factor MinE